MNHVLQSTAFAAVAATLAFALRRYSAKTRYVIWLAASLKFLVPLSLLFDLGVRIARHTARATPAAVSTTLRHFSGPLAPLSALNVNFDQAHIDTGDSLKGIFTVVWAVGSLIVFTSWTVRWLRIRRCVHAGSPLTLRDGTQAITSYDFAEPGVYGILRPVLLLPPRIALEAPLGQLRAIVAHELCHMRRRDNLTAALHMGVEAIFWFHPLVWWIGSRLLEERERACDEEVLRQSDPETYAAGILTVCELCLEPSLPCVSGVTGGQLHKRIEQIMSSVIPPEVSRWKTSALLSAAAVVLLACVIAGAQSIAPSTARFEVISIKENVSGAVNEGTPPLQHGRLRFTNVTVQGIISLAFYPLDFDHIKGAPAWTAIGRSGAHYDIEAITEERVRTEERYHQMLQTMLLDRFGLRFHWETHQEPVYLLVVDKKGLKLKTTDLSSCMAVPPETTLTPNGTPCGKQYTFSGTGSGGGLHFEGVGMTMKTLAVVLGLSGRPVLDRTGYEGMVDVKLDFTPANRHLVDIADGPPSLLDALPEQLGLRLQSATGPVDTMVIDHIERPSPN